MPRDPDKYDFFVSYTRADNRDGWISQFVEELVAAWVAVHESASYAGLADGLGLDDLDLIAEHDDVTLRRHNHERRLQAVLGPTLDALTDAERLALQYAACLAPNHIPLPWLRELVVEQFPELAQRGRLGDPWEELCNRLLRLAVFSRGVGEGHRPRLVRVHRLVQDLVRRELSPDDLSGRQQAVEKLVRQRDAALEQTTRWQDARWELEPLDALAKHWDENQHPDTAWLLNQTAVRCHGIAEWTRAEPVMRRALAIAEQSYGPDHPKVATDLNNLALLLYDTNRLAEAEPVSRRHVEIFLKFTSATGHEHPHLQSALRNYAGLLQAMGVSDTEIRQRLNELLSEYGMSLG